MRVAIAGPSKLKSLEKRNPEAISLIKGWLSAQLDALLLKNESVVAATSLHLGLDTYFAALCRHKGIPYTVFLSCDDQDKFWDEENREFFAHLLEEAEEVIKVTEGGYSQGCIKKQSNAITEWLREEDSRLLLVKNKKLSQSQTERKQLLNNSQIIIYKV